MRKWTPIGLKTFLRFVADEGGFLAQFSRDFFDRRNAGEFSDYDIDQAEEYGYIRVSVDLWSDESSYRMTPDGWRALGMKPPKTRLEKLADALRKMRDYFQKTSAA